jgi:hypothetical protein
LPLLDIHPRAHARGPLGLLIAGKAFAVKALRRMNGDSTFYNLFGPDVSCLRIKTLRDLEIEFLIC